MMNYNKKKYLLHFIKYCDKNKKQVIKENKNLNIRGQKTINKIVMYYIDKLYNYDLNHPENEIFIKYEKRYNIMVQQEEKLNKMLDELED